MAMTIGDANDVQALGRWILGVDYGAPDVAELQGDQAREALRHLLERSVHRLGAGLGEDAVDMRWPAPGLPNGCRSSARGDS